MLFLRTLMPSKIIDVMSVRLTKARWLLAVIFFTAIFFVFAHHLQFMLAKLALLGMFMPLGFLLLYCFMSVFCLPTTFLVLAGGALFGPVMGVFMNVSGATLGAMCGFCISRYLRTDAYTLGANMRIQKLVTQIERKGWQSVALLRLTPFIPYNLVNYGLGLTRIKFSSYLLGTLIFLIPSKIVVTCCGYYGIHFLDHKIVQFTHDVGFKN